MPSFTACWRNDPALRFIILAILATGVLAFEWPLRSLLSCLLQERRAIFRLVAARLLLFAIILSLSANYFHTSNRQKING